ncbi:unnamed protein product, partial [Brachionus calyciflorus]
KYDLYQLNVLESNAKCIKTKEVNHIRTTLCVHSSSIDYTSYKISTEGIKEEELVSSFLEVLNKTKNCLAIDIGTHVGLFTLFAAKLGKQVISVEPFHDNIIRLQKGAELENIRDKIVLLKYAVSKKKNEKVLLSPHKNIADKLFNRLDIKMVFMEWDNLRKKTDLIKEINEMIDFLVERNYVPFDPIKNRRLNLSEWKNKWGIDVVWKKTNKIS